VDHAAYHKTPKVKKFLKELSLFKVRFLGKKDPNYNSTERLVNKRLSAAASVNRPHQNLSVLKERTKKILRKYDSIYEI